ncbi:uncharacterized protein LOC126457355 [Schistocerca serialis cubense]|uniref:uncharacterized protein LOC126457355 n=1 Tax=Schistocerca serialis cubense TaxID=2023355 RepID=UPI00214E9014|nr:uncharacterized protein LOC126457355 [Schistocerca serialis cubense]
METPEGFRIVRAQPSDRDRVERLARTAFYPDEPMNVALGNTRGPPTDQLLFLSALDEPHSLIAEDASTGEAVGMCINGIVSPEVHEKKKQLQPQDEVLRTVLRVLRAVWAEADVWSRTAARCALEVRILAVASSARGRGLAAALLAESLRMAKEELRLPLALILCTSAFSAKLSQQAGMRLVYEKPYCQTDMPAQPPQPHDRIAIYMLDLQD